MKKNKIFKITFCAIMASMSTILTFFEVNLPVFNVALYGLPLVFVSVIYGPGYGFLTGLVAGSIEQITKGISVQTLLWIIAPLAWGGLSGVIYYTFKKIINDDKVYKKIIIYSLAIFVSIFISNLSNSLAMAVFGYTKNPISNVGMFLAFYIPRLISIPMHMIIYVPLCYIVCERMRKFIFNIDDNKEVE